MLLVAKRPYCEPSLDQAGTALRQTLDKAIARRVLSPDRLATHRSAAPPFADLVRAIDVYARVAIVRWLPGVKMAFWRIILCWLNLTFRTMFVSERRPVHLHIVLSTVRNIAAPLPGRARLGRQPRLRPADDPPVRPGAQGPSPRSRAASQAACRNTLLPEPVIPVRYQRLGHRKPCR